jgi:putative oxidoreductase
MNQSSTHFQGVVSLVGRILLATIFFVSGLSKIADPASTIGYLTAVGMPLPEVAYAITVVLEVVGGLFLFLGYRVQPAAIALAVFSVVAAVLFHGQIGDQNQFAHLLKNISIAGGLLHVAAFGAGSLSLDRRRLVTPTGRIA